MASIPRLPTLALAILTPLVVLLPAGSGHAQSFEGSVFAGAALMVADLTDEFLVDTGNRVEMASQSHDNGLALGARIGMHWPAIALEGTLAVIPTNLVTRLELSPDIVESQTIIVVGADALYSFASGRFMEFFVAAGGGLKSYSADDPGGGFESGVDPMVNLGGGARLFVTPNMAVRADVRNYISRFDAFATIPGSEHGPKTQHDVLLTVGLSYRATR